MNRNVSIAGDRMGPGNSLGEALIVDDDPIVLSILEKALTECGYLVTTANNAAAALRRIDRSVPEVILTDMIMPGMNGRTFCRKIRKNVNTAGVPIIMISSESRLEERLQGLKAGADDFITKPFNMLEVKARLDRLVARNQRALASNPLSHLPGNPSIELEANRRLTAKKPFAFVYVDIDDFKAYNDVYGYQAGDLVIKGLARLLVAAASSVSHDTFVGHVGGDDFVMIGRSAQMRVILDMILATFDREAGSYYTTKDKLRGGIITANRQHHKQFFPMMKLSCAAIDTSIRQIQHYAELVEIATELKHHLKSQRHRTASRAQWNGRLRRERSVKR